MSDFQYTDEFGFPLTAGQSLLRRRQGVPLQTGATERAGFTPMPVTVHELAEDAAVPSKDENDRSHHAG